MWVWESVSGWVSSVYWPDAPQIQNYTTLLPSHQHKHVTSASSSSFFLSHTNRSLQSTYQHKPSLENIMFAAVATCTDWQALTTYTPSVMFYKHILNNSAHPHLPNGLFFPEGAWLLFDSPRLSFCSCLPLFLRLVSPRFLCCMFVAVYSVW